MAGCEAEHFGVIMGEAWITCERDFGHEQRG